MGDPLPLPLHSAFSFHWGPCSVAALVRAAGRLGYRKLALTDRNSLSGLPAFAEACAEAGILPVFGVDLDDATGDRVVLLARHRGGFSALCRLVSGRSRDPHFRLRDQLPPLAMGDGLFVLTDRVSLVEAWAGRVEGLHGLVTQRSSAVVVACARRAVPVVAGLETAWLEPADREVQRVLRAIGSLRPVAAVSDDELSPNPAVLDAPGAVGAWFSDFPEAVAQNARLAESISFHELSAGTIFPKWDRGPSARLELERRAYAGARRRYGDLGEAVLDRLDHELGVIDAKGFSDYFLIVADIVALSPRTCGRGSGAASLVAYCLGITNVDPVRHDLYFERFLNAERVDLPDIDVDFAWDERDGVLRQVFEAYGVDRCARVCNHLHFRGRSAFREVALAFGVDPEAPGADAEAIGALAARIGGLPRGLSVHSGGVVLTPGPIADHAPVSDAPSAVVVGWEKDGTEAAGLVKIDLLGNRSLAVIRDSLANLVDEGIVVDQASWHPEDDPVTQALLARGDSIGVFYVESPAMRQLQKKTGQGDFAHLVIHSSIIRPAANSFINDYVDRLKKTVTKWPVLDRRLDDLLTETYGIMCYQEDISKASMALAGFTEGQADQLRKAVSKPGSTRLAHFAQQFRQGCLDNQVAPEAIETIWSMVLSFGGYSFCKPHSASYAMVSFQSAWLKAHHGPEFHAAVLANQGGFYTPGAYVSEIRRRGIGFDGPDVNASGANYRARAGRVRAGLGVVSGVSSATVTRILAVREDRGAFRGPEDFASRVRPARDEVQALVEAGALDALAPDLDRQTLLRRAWVALDRSSTQATGPTWEDDWSEVAEPRVSPVRPTRTRRDREAEMERLGYLVDHHPLVLWRDAVKGVDRVRARDLETQVGRRVRLLGWPVTLKPVETKTGQAMEFVTFEDEDCLFETVLFPEAYDRYSRLVDFRRPLWVWGEVQDDRGAVGVHVTRLEPVDRAGSVSASPLRTAPRRPGGPDFSWTGGPGRGG